VDGASAVLIASERYVRDHGLKPRAKVLATATCGAEPVIMLTAPGPASERALAKAGMQKGDVVQNPFYGKSMSDCGRIVPATATEQK